jgi:signal transduction histidine kinase
MALSPGTARPVPWVPSVLYGAVLLGGAFYGIVGDESTPLWRLFGFVIGLLVLTALDVAERWRHPVRTPAGPAIALLAMRFLLFVAVSTCDESGISRALFVLIPFTAYFTFGRRVSIALGVACVGLLVVWFSLSVPRWYVDAEYISDLVMFGLGLVLAVSMAAYADRAAEMSAVTERNRLAREIHDSLGHHLTAIAIQLEKAEAFRDRDAAHAERAVADARWSADRALEEIRHSVSALHAGAGPFSLPAALDDLVRHVDGGRVRVTLDVSGEQDDYDIGTLTALYRAAQEGLTNVHRHADAAHVSVSLDFGESAARLVIADDGRGMPSNGSSGRPGFGLKGMRERVRLLGGEIEVEAGREGGTTLAIAVPRVAVPREPR